MKRRTRIGLNLAHAWRDLIETEYPRGHINSEPALQAYYFAYLKGYLDRGQSNRKVFVEPRVELSTGKTVIPDLVICSPQEVIAVVELKYKPKAARPGIEKDMNSLHSIASGQDLCINIHRLLGTEECEREYLVSTTTLFAWAGVHRGTTLESGVWTKDDTFANHLFLELHATTSPEANPTLTCNSNAFRKPKNFVSNRRE